MADYKILSLDGGGSWALIQAKALQVLYDDAPGRDILRRFNFVAANSGGSIVAGGLALNMRPSAIANVFLDEDIRTRIFVEKWFAGLKRWLGLGARYRTDKKLPGLLSALHNGAQAAGSTLSGATPLDQLASGTQPFPDFLICSFDFDLQRAAYFRSNLNSKSRSEPVHPDEVPPTLAEALHASSNAPINYFDEPAELATPYYANHGKRYWDGGTAGLNNPVLAAVTEAIANGAAPADMRVLSIGTANVRHPVCGPNQDANPPYVKDRAGTGLLSTLSEMASTILDDPPDAATYEAFRILHGGGRPLPANVPLRLVRMNPLIQPVTRQGQWGAPDGLDVVSYPDCDTDTREPSEKFKALVNLQMDAVGQDEVCLIRQFCDAWINAAGHLQPVPNQPIQSLDNFECAIGHATFAGAMAQARAIGL